jgi:hypothetical protein
MKRLIRSPQFFTILCGCFALAVAACFPIWDVYFPWQMAWEDEKTWHTSGTFDHVLWELPLVIKDGKGELVQSNLIVQRGWGGVAKAYRRNFAIIAGTFIAGALIGRAVYWLRWERGRANGQAGE